MLSPRSGLRSRAIARVLACTAYALSYFPVIVLIASALFIFYRERAATDIGRLAGEARYWVILGRTQLWSWSLAAVLLLVSLSLAYALLVGYQPQSDRFIALISTSYGIAEIVRILALYMVLDRPSNSIPLWPDLFSRAGAFCAFIYLYAPLALVLTWGVVRSLGSDTLKLASSLGASRVGVVVRIIFGSRRGLLFLVSFLLAQIISSDYLVPRLVGGASVSTYATLVAFYLVQARSAEAALVLTIAHVTISVLIGSLLWLCLRIR